MLKKLLSIGFLLGVSSVGWSQISSFPWTEDFETTSNCIGSCYATCGLVGSDFTNTNLDNMDWIADQFGTTSSFTGPTANGGADHNPGVSGGRYLYLESSGCYNTTGNLISPYFNFTSVPVPYLEFWWHMFGSSMGTMHFDIDTNGNWINDYIPSWTANVDQWQQTIVSLVELGGMNNVRFRIRGVTGFSFTSDMAVDDFTVSDTTFSVLANIQPNLCDGDSSGAISVDGIFGLAPFTYAWSNGSTAAALSGLEEGTYTVTITDANGNTATETFVFDAPAITTTQTILQNMVCKYDVGAAKVVATGGTPITASYLVDTASANYDPDSSSTGTSVTLSDDQVSANLNIGFDFTFFGNTYSTFNISSNGFITFAGPTSTSGCCSGQLIPNPSTANNLIALCWDDLYPPGAGSITYYTTGAAPFRTLVVNFTDIPYCCNSTSAVSVQAKLFETSNCIEIHTNYVNNASPATQGIENAAGTEAYTYPGRNSSFWSSGESFISFCPPQGGFIYLWPDGVTDTLNPTLTSGIHVVTVSDQNGCEAYDTVNISAPVSNLTLDPIVNHVSCFGFDDGSIQSNQAGGVAPIAYAWSSGETTADISNLEPGSYTVVATDNLGCLDSAVTVMIEEPSILLSAINNIEVPNCPDDAAGSATVVATGGRLPYTYEWTDGQTSTTATGLVAGVYNVTVTDSSGCESVQGVAIEALNPSPAVDLGVNYLSTTGIGVTLNAGTHATYLWSTQETTPTIHVGQTGTYWVEVANGAGCTSSDTVYVEIWPNGINEKDGTSILALFPNPTQDVLTLDMKGADALSDVNITIIDMQGRVVLQNQVQALTPGSPLTLNVDGLVSGMYTISVQSDDVSLDRTFVKL